MKTIDIIFENSDWLTADEIDYFRGSQPTGKLQACDWKEYGRVFIVPYNGTEYYARYQFDLFYQPLPVIKEILHALGENIDPWAVAAWFHFPNGWIIEEGADGAIPVSPKDALHRGEEVINAALNRKGTYVA